MYRPLFVAIAFAAGAAIAFAADPATQAAAPATVVINGYDYNPSILTVAPGTTVTWVNEDDIPHTVVSAPNVRSKPLDSEDKFSFTFTTPGTYKYFCSLHPHMTGTIVVQTATGDNAPK
jgi:plastocyanin